MASFKPLLPAISNTDRTTPADVLLKLLAGFNSTGSTSRINFLSCLGQGIPVNLSIVSDDAGQLNVFNHTLRWIGSSTGSLH
jgi:hypothetical protein